MGVFNVLVKVVNEYYVCVLDKIGVDMVVYLEWDMGIWIVYKFVLCNILDYIELFSEFLLVEVWVINFKFYNKILVELNFC